MHDLQIPTTFDFSLFALANQLRFLDLPGLCGFIFDHNILVIDLPRHRLVSDHSETGFAELLPVNFKLHRPEERLGQEANLPGQDI